MKANIKLELKTLTPLRLAALMCNVASKLDGNPHFPAPPLSAADLKAQEKVFTAAIIEAIDGSLASKAQRNALELQARNSLRLLASYVRMMAQDNAAILATSGFELARRPGPPQPIGSPVLVTARMTGRHGEVELRWSGVVNRRAYNIYMSEQDPTDPACKWTLTGITGKITHRVQGLEAYKAYWFWVSAVGALGEGLMSDPVLGRAA
ncbi:MAG: fibronectin type III domain-containing protein [Flavobacteriales bacterium]